MDSKKSVTKMKYNCYRLFNFFMIYFIHRKVVKKVMIKSKREQELEEEVKKLKKEIDTLKKTLKLKDKQMKQKKKQRKQK